MLRRRAAIAPAPTSSPPPATAAPTRKLRRAIRLPREVRDQYRVGRDVDDMKDVKAGDTLGPVARTLTREDIAAYAEASGDRNPLHLDDAHARSVGFPSVIAHGMLTASLISTVVGTRLPGTGSIYLSQSLNFRRPVRIGDTVTVVIEVVELIEKGARCRLSTTALVDGEVVMDGEAKYLTGEDLDKYCDAEHERKRNDYAFSRNLMSILGAQQNGKFLVNPTQFSLLNKLRKSIFLE